MNRATKILLATAAAAAAVMTTTARADQFDLYQNQQEIADGYYVPAFPVKDPAPSQLTLRQAAESRWFDDQRAAASNGSRPVPFEQALHEVEAERAQMAAQSGSQQERKPVVAEAH